MARSNKAKKEEKEKKKLEIPKGFPKELTLFSQKWKVNYVTQVDKSEWLLGSSSALDREIRIDLEQARESMVEVLVHEIAHSYFAHVPGDLNPELEEMMAQLFGVFFLDLVRNSPPFWEEP
jgi:hypothetical protein